VPGPSLQSVRETYERPLLDLVYEAQTVHRRHHDPRRVQWSTLLSIKTGGCPEDCGYCSQSAHWKTSAPREPLMSVDDVVAAARRAREGGASRFCMGAAWRRPADRDLARVEEMVTAVKALGLETCATLGSLDAPAAARLRAAGLDYYNHNLDTSREHYGLIVTTRTYDERIGTLRHAREAGLKVCCGGILGMGESRADRVGLLCELANLSPPPESVPINALVPIEATPLADAPPLDWTEFVRTTATARILMPTSAVRLSAGRKEMPEAVQALCFLAGANSIFAGDRLLTTPNPGADEDRRLLERLGLVAG
jgi:biotin synthase